ncbi:MAG: hypothetical protein IT299_11185 [Dehalococcoidia bacterium]|nr:hypothetical protein [Dehalococcoidia bacterium]
MASGRWNVAGGFLFISLFVVLGFVLVYLRDFAPGKDAWVADYAVGKHFETRLAHAHGNLFALVNIAMGLVLPRLAAGATTKRALAWITLGGLLMPVGILGEVVLGTSPVFVLLGGAMMFVAVTWAGVIAAQGWNAAAHG